MNNLRFPFNHLHKWVLVVFLATVGLLVHLVIASVFGLIDGFDNWKTEMEMLIYDE